MGYHIANSTNPVLGERYISPQPAPDSVGIISLPSSDDGMAGLVVMWGFSPAYPSGPWCRIQPENEFATSKSQQVSLEVFLNRQILKVREGDEATCLALRPDAAHRRRMDSVVIGSRQPVSVTIKLSVISFLDRTAIDLQFDVVPEVV